MSSPTEYQAHIGGRWQGAANMVDVRDPSDWDTVIAQVPALSPDMVRSGMSTIRDGANIWRGTNAVERSRVLYRAAALIRERSNGLAALLSRENGKTLVEATGEVGKAADFFEFYAGVSRLPYGEMIYDSRPTTTTTVRHQPVGVVLAITPWNDPLLTPARKLAPALIAGNSIVLKPASDTPAIALELTRALLDAGLPPEAITTVTGHARDIADVLVESSEIDAITFTGSTEVGLALQRKVAGRNLRIQCEMGGKNAAIVLADADLELACQTIAAAGFGQGGQRCTATSRVLVEESVKGPFIERLISLATAMTPGAGDQPASTFGPLVNRDHQGEVLTYIARAREQGATVRSGGTPGETDALTKGCYVLPTVLDDITTEMNIWQEEVFGPVVAALPIASLNEGIDLANASPYGLAASLFTSNLASADVFLRDIECGQAAVNLPTSGWDVHHPFGGFKLSGSPFKEQGLDALHFYTRTKTCAVRSA
jgi:acyl-CoA reductase-like NAD-dependent aldehyde dehydrogenase